MAANHFEANDRSRPWAAPTTPGSRSLRRGRTSLFNHVYLVTTSTVDRVRVFEELKAGRLLALALNDPVLLGDARTLAWVAMPDHLHWLLQLGRNFTLGALVMRLKSSSARQVNRLLHRPGPLWQQGFHDHLVRDEENLLNVARYIVANPLRAGLVRRVGDYPHWDAIWLQ